MSSLFESIRQRLAGGSAATVRFYRANSTLLLGAFTILSVLLIVWARLGFTFEINRFFAAETPIDPSGACVFKTDMFNDPDGASGPNGAWYCNSLQCNLAGNPPFEPMSARKPPSGPASRLAVKLFRLIDIAPDPAKGPIHVRTVLDATPKSGSSEGYPPKDPLWTCTAAPGVMELGRNGHDFYDCYNPIIHRYNYGPITCCANTGLAGDCFTWDLQGPSPSPSPSPSASLSPSPTESPDPNAPPAGTMVGVCTGGSTPSITVKYSKLPPPGTTQPVNSNGMNKGTTPPGGTRTVVQLDPYTPTDKGQYWEWTDTAVQSGYTYDYRAKYHPDVSTNTVTIATTPENCGGSVATLPPLTCAPVSQTVDVRERVEVEADGGTGSYTWEAFQDGDEIDVDANGDTASVRFTEEGTHSVQVTSGGRTASCRVVVRDNNQSNYTHLECINGTCARVAGQGANQCSTDRAACSGTSETPTIVVTARNISTGGAESDNVQVRTGQQIELRMRITNRSGSATLNGIMVDAALPAGVSYIPGSTTVRTLKTEFNTLTAGGLDIGALGPNQNVLVTARATVSAAQFAVGTTQVQAAARSRAAGAQDVSDTVQLTVTRPGGGSGSGDAQTGPGEALLAAFLISAVMTLLYTSYTHTSAYKRHEVGSISKQHDPLDFKS